MKPLTINNTHNTEGSTNIEEYSMTKESNGFNTTKSMMFKLSPKFQLSPALNSGRKNTLANDEPDTKKMNKTSMKGFQLSPIQSKKTIFQNDTSYTTTRKYHSLNNNNNSTTNTRFQTEIKDPDDYFEKLPLTIRLQTPYTEQILGYEDMKPKEIIGPNAVNKFYSHYKKLDKITDQNKFHSNPDSVYTAFLKKTESLNLLPSKIGFIKFKGEESKLTLSHFSLGDKYAEVLSEGLRSVTSVSSVDLANNRLSAKGADHILSNLTRNTQIINLANNKIGYIGCGHIANLLINKAARLIELNLESNLLGDAALRPLLDALAANNSIRRLNLSRNYLTNNSAERISKMIENNSGIDELYLKWNQMNGSGGACIIKGIMNSVSRIKVLDFSWNSFGGIGSRFAQIFAEFIANNENLVHLDLSHNNFTKDESKTISEALEKNHTLYGIHYDGNYGYIDPNGFLRVIDVPCEKVSVNYIPHQIRSVLANHEYKKYKITELGQYKECCWICEGWREVEFKWTPLISGLANDDPIYIHLYHEGYRNIFLPMEDNFYTMRMCPPEKIYYFYTGQVIQTIANDQEKCHPNEQEIKFTIYDKPCKEKFEYVNYYINRFNATLFDPITYTTTCQVKPRIIEKIYIPPETKIERIPWTFALSIFRDYKSDNAEIIKKCFEVDFENTRIPKFVKKPEELAAVKELLRDAYKHIKESYRFYASIGVVSDIWCVHQAEINEFCRQTNLKDVNFLDEKELGLLSIKTYTKGADSPFAKNPRNPDRALVRYQFLEFILRVAEECVVSKGFFKTYPEAVKFILDEKILPHAKTFDHHKFRLEKYWTEGCDTVYKTYLPVVQSTYRRYSGMKTKPGQKKFMCLEELFKMVNDCQLLNDNLVDRDVSVIFNVSMMTQVDELNQDRIYQMSFLEFLECLARIADVYSAANIGENEADIPYEVREARPLHYKLEGLIAILFYRGCEIIIRENYMLPDKSIFDWSLEEQQKAAKIIGKRRTIVMVDPVTKPNMPASAD